MRDEFSPEQWAELLAFDQVEPTGETRMDLRFAWLAWTLLQSQTKEKLPDGFSWYHGLRRFITKRTTKQPTPELTPDQVAAQVRK